MTSERLRILVVDDDESIRGYISKLLSQNGYDVITASSGKEALEKVRVEEDLALVLLDIVMPEMDGLETLNEIRKLSDDLPVLMLSALGQTNTIVKAMITDGIDSFVNEDADLAMSVCERDSIVDGLRDQIMRELITFMTSDPATIERALHLMKIAANLERVADLTTNICEDVIYMVKGKNIKHHKCSL